MYKNSAGVTPTRSGVTLTLFTDAVWGHTYTFYRFALVAIPVCPGRLQNVKSVGVTPDDLADITRVAIYHEDQIIGDFSSLSPAGVSVPYTLTENGVHTFWSRAPRFRSTWA